MFCPRAVRLVAAMAALLIACDAVDAQNEATAPPHVSRQGANMILNPSVKTKANWSFLRDAEYDASSSRTDDGSGSMKLVTPAPNTSMVLSDLIPVRSGQRYTYGFYFKTGNGPTFPNLRREVEQLLPIIREPHWTEWKVKADPPDHVRVGTRDHKGEGYLILVNQTTKPQTVTLTLKGLPSRATGIRDAFSDEQVATVRDGSFSSTLPKIGVRNGTRVLRILGPIKKP